MGSIAEKDYRVRNRYMFGLGTIGRDMLYTIVSMFLLVYFTEVLKVSKTEVWWITGIMVGCRIFDAFNDPIMGTIVDNTKTRWGKFKPWIVIGAILSGILTILLFTNFNLSGAAFIVMFGILYLLWGMAFTTNDISYWSMMPSLTSDQKEREKIGAFARICANIGLFVVVAGIVPITKAIGSAVGDIRMGYTIFAIIIVVILLIGQAITVLGVKEPKAAHREKKTTIKEMFSAIFKNDQLLVTAIAMALFMIGYMTTTSFGIYFFKYAYGNEDMYTPFTIILGVSQLLALAVFPLFSKRLTRKQLYFGSTIMVVLGYILFFFSPNNNMILIGISGVLLFFGQAFIQLLMLVFLADTVEYGDLKLGQRNESVSFSIQPFINKMGGAIGTGIVGVTLNLANITESTSITDVTSGGLWLMKIAMLVIPLIFIVLGFILYLFKYKIDKKSYEKILADLAERDKNLLIEQSEIAKNKESEVLEKNESKED